ncbi:MAG: hypothetical protein HC886_17530 [Leptolyngbyaceae cyanobacterium SM1_1_3]|nr:hypothetical protein [Leptolyngbyaceae cyanobacterium SM1_1_3]
MRFQQRQLSEAEAIYLQVLALKPNDWQTRRVLAELKLAQDQPIAARERFSELQVDALAAETQPPINYRLQDIELNFLRRRGFQPCGNGTKRIL